jgi:peroxiredoxin (alkyl hydroperoxide reductase subunit C)
MIATGAVAPDFALPNRDRQIVRLSQYRGVANVVLAFHPLAFTPVCSAQMQGYERELPRLKALDAQILSISNDANPSKKAWAESLGGISYEMLSDYHPHGAVAEAYGVLREDGLAERAIVVVDKQGIVRWTRRYEIPEHPDVEELMENLDKLRTEG